MPIVAFAFHEHVAMEKLNAYFESAAAAGGETRTTKCPPCLVEFPPDRWQSFARNEFVLNAGRK